MNTLRNLGMQQQQQQPTLAVLIAFVLILFLYGHFNGWYEGLD